MNSYQQPSNSSTMNQNDPNIILEEYMNPDPDQFDRFVENFDFGAQIILGLPDLGPNIDYLLQRNEVPHRTDENKLDLSCFKEDRSWEQEKGHQGILIDQIVAEIWIPTNTIRMPVEPSQVVHQFTGQQVEEQDPQSSFINYPESWIQVSQDDSYNQAHNYQWPQNPQNPAVQSYQSESLEPKMVQQQMDVHEFSRACFDVFLTSDYSHKFSVSDKARKLLARHKKLFHVLPQAKRAFLKREIFNIFKETQSTEPPKRPSPNPFYRLLKLYRMDTFQHLFEKMHTKIDEPQMRQILWDFFDYYHVKKNQYC